MVQEIIEIGAYKVDRYGEVLSYFSSFVRPVIHPQLSLFCKQLTSIEQQDVNRASEFPAVVEDWQDWIGIFDEDYVLAAWGAFDIKQLRADCRLHRMEEDWLDSNINLKKQYAEIRGLRKPRGLRAAVDKEGFEFTGEQHRAIDDAQNLVKIFRKLLDVWRY